MKKVLKVIGIIWCVLFLIGGIVAISEGIRYVIPFVLLAAIGLVPLFIFKKDENIKAKSKLHVQDELTSSGFVTSKEQKISNMKLLVDEVNKKFAITTKKNARIFDFSDLLDFELNEDGNSITKGKGLATAVGGVTFGVVGALVGSSGKRKSESTCNSMIIRIMVNNLREPQIVIPLIKNMEVKKNSMTYTINRELAKEVVATLVYIQSQI